MRSGRKKPTYGMFTPAAASMAQRLTGGAAALIAQRIKKAQVIAYEELGAEALQQLEVENFPVIVVNDMFGGDAYEEGKKQWARK